MWAYHFLLTDTATTEIYTLSLHDALPISRSTGPPRRTPTRTWPSWPPGTRSVPAFRSRSAATRRATRSGRRSRSRGPRSSPGAAPSWSPSTDRSNPRTLRRPTPPDPHHPSPDSPRRRPPRGLSRATDLRGTGSGTSERPAETPLAEVPDPAGRRDLRKRAFSQFAPRYRFPTGRRTDRSEDRQVGGPTGRRAVGL